MRRGIHFPDMPSEAFVRRLADTFFNPEIIINHQVPVLADILERLKVKHSLSFEFEGTSDVLNPNDYPVAFEKAVEYIKRNSEFHKRYSFPRNRRIIVQREVLENDRFRKKPRFIDVSNKHPLCYRFAFRQEKKHVGDLFIIPIMANRTAGQAWIDETTTTSCETLLIVADAHSSRERKKRIPPECIEVEPRNRVAQSYVNFHADNNSPVGFTLLTDKSLRDEEDAADFSHNFAAIFREWMGKKKYS